MLKLQLARLPINPKVVQVWVFLCKSFSDTRVNKSFLYRAHDRTLKKRERLSTNGCYEVESTQFCSMSLRPIVAREQTELWSVTQASHITTDTHFNPSRFSWSIISSPRMAFLTAKKHNKISCRKIRRSLSSSLTGTEIKKLKWKWNELQDLTEIALFQKY